MDEHSRTTTCHRVEGTQLAGTHKTNVCHSNLNNLHHHHSMCRTIHQLMATYLLDLLSQPHHMGKGDHLMPSRSRHRRYNHKYSLNNHRRNRRHKYHRQRRPNKHRRRLYPL